jgi:hypothetical protein
MEKTAIDSSAQIVAVLYQLGDMYRDIEKTSYPVT